MYFVPTQFPILFGAQVVSQVVGEIGAMANIPKMAWGRPFAGSIRFVHAGMALYHGDRRYLLPLLIGLIECAPFLVPCRWVNVLPLVGMVTFFTMKFDWILQQFMPIEGNDRWSLLVVPPLRIALLLGACTQFDELVIPKLIGVPTLLRFGAVSICLVHDLVEVK